MTEAETILKMIETVDPADTAKLDEIDARAWCWLHDCEFLEYDRGAFYCNPKTNLPFWKGIVPYTTSRDALKAIRPKGWYTRGTAISDRFHGYQSTLICLCDRKSLCSAKSFTGIAPSFYAPTEELAELHAIIQAIEYERRNEATSP